MTHEFKHPKYWAALRKEKRAQALKLTSSQAGGRVGPKGSSLQAGERASSQASSGARINKR
jgi:hypothetical protein